MPDIQTQPWIPLATVALHAAINRDHPAASRAVQRIHDEHGADAIVFAMLAWCDTAIAANPRMADADTFALISDAGELHMADQAPPEAAWAARLLMARAKDDRQTFRALINSIPDLETYSRNVFALLDMAGMALAPTATEERP